MAFQRTFFDWHQPLLPAVADRFMDRFTTDGMIDGSRTIIVVPGGEAGRRLNQLMLDRAETSGKVYLPPAVLTEGSLPEQLYHPRQPNASDVTQLMIWVEVLRKATPDELRPIVPNPPSPDATSAWLDLARLLRSQHNELAKADHDFSSVLACSHVQQSPEELRRWQSLTQLQTRYLARIDALGYWDIQTARRKAVEYHECRTEHDIVLVGTVDLLPVLRSMLDQVARPVAAVVHAPESLADRFDEHGCLITAAWLDADLPFHDDQIKRVDGANDQAVAVAHELSQIGNRLRSDQITIGLPDEGLAPSIDRTLRQHGLRTRFVGGRTLDQSGPVCLLAAVAGYLRQRDYASFAALVRHPDLFRWLAERESGDGGRESEVGERESDSRWSSDLLTAFDSFYSERLPSDFDCLSPYAREGSIVDRASKSVGKLIEPLMADAADASDWLAPLRELLSTVYARVELRSDEPADQPTIKALAELAASFADLEQIPEEVTPRMTAAETISLALDKLRGVNVPPPRDPTAIEMLGWLELALDDAPALIVTTFNEGRVPSYVDADLFLPEPIRRELGVRDNDHRYARDSYATAVLLHARKHVRFLVARRNVSGDPLTPSRLLFATDRETIARRAQVMFSEFTEPLPASRPPVVLPPQSTLPVPPAEPLDQPLDEFRVTSFRTYLACPYRYYLSHVLKLQTLSDKAAELEANTFGTLLHDCLDAFGKDADARSLDQPDAIFAFLNQQLDAEVKRKFLSRDRGAIAVQIAQLRRRLEAFAAWQADRRAHGWEITSVEERMQAIWETEAGPITLTGRVDRIDVHATTGQVVVFDYKSGDSAKKPDAVHRFKKEWVDLQLPLYRHLVAANGFESEVALGYIVLPRDVTQVGERLAEWTTAELNEADGIARRVIGDIRAGRFEPISDEVNPRYDDFAAICQSRSLGRQPAIVEEGEDE